MEMRVDSVEQYPGNWSDYLYHNSLFRENAEDGGTILTKTAIAKQKKLQREQLKKRQEMRLALEEVENDILLLEERNDSISLLLSDSGALTEAQLSGFSEEYAKNHIKIEQLMERWETLSHEREEINKRSET